MDRSKLGILIFLVLFLGTSCVVETVDAFIPEPELPVRIHAQDAWASVPQRGTNGSLEMSERETIHSCIQEWNDLVAPRLKEGEPLPLEFSGFLDDPEFNSEIDLVDNIHMIYRIPDTTPELQQIPGDPLGYGLAKSGDVLVIISEFASTLERENQPDGFAMLLRVTVCHEIGHVLGIQHQFVRPGVMNYNTPWDRPDESGRVVREADVEGFCLVHPGSCVNKM